MIVGLALACGVALLVEALPGRITHGYHTSETSHRRGATCSRNGDAASTTVMAVGFCYPVRVPGPAHQSHEPTTRQLMGHLRTVIGILYDFSLPALIAFSLVVELAAIPLFILVGRQPRLVQ
jgi:hypothetical protein